ncbi:MAG: LssY C-terminal domain-containing protein [Thermoguttaceae bacterium]
MPIAGSSIFRWLVIPYSPSPDAPTFFDAAVTQQRDGLEVRVAVQDGATSRKFFGVPMARRGVQPVWVHVVNHSDQSYRLQFVALDPNYFSPLEAAALNHYSSGKRLLGFGLLAWWLWVPILILLPIKLFAVRRANRKMDAFFLEHAFRMRPIPAGGEHAGFVFTNLSEGNKVVLVRLLGPDGTQDFEFSLPVDGLRTDYLRREFHVLHAADKLTEVDLPGLRQYLASVPQATTNSHGLRPGDPLNLVVVGDYAAVLGAFGARWDETEVISLATCWKTFRAFLTGGEYRYSPVSGLFLFGRSQDFALQRIRNSINERLHLRLWATPLQFRGQRVWVGQVSRDIGVRLTWRTWNLTTHRIDPDVDEAREYVVEDLTRVGRLGMAGYVDGVVPCDQTNPRRNLTGDPYFTDGKRAVLFLSESRTTPKYLAVP